MCGIIGYVGHRRRIRELLLKGISRMEYRGYDSAGLCTQTVGKDHPEEGTRKEGGRFELVRAAGKIDNLCVEVGMTRLVVFLVWSQSDVLLGSAPPALLSQLKQKSTPQDAGKKKGETKDDLSFSPSDLRRETLKSKAFPAKPTSDEVAGSVLLVIENSATVAEVVESARMAFATECNISVPVTAELQIEEGSSLINLDTKKTLGEITASSKSGMITFRLTAEKPVEGFKVHAKPAAVFEETVNIGLAHTRWATHGEPCPRNAHPHVSSNGRIAVVHNGIIENKDELKEALIQAGKVFKSDTDTEVIPMLIEFELERGQGIEVALYQAISKMRGAYGVAIMVEGDPRLFAFRLGSPLCVGVGNGENFVGSEPSAFLSYSNRKIDLEDYEVAIISDNNVEIHKINFSAPGMSPEDRLRALESGEAQGNALLSPVMATIPEGDMARMASEHVLSRTVKVPFNLEEVRKGKFKHFMLKEIHEQPTVLQNTINSKTMHVDGLTHIDIDVPSDLHAITFLACGTSHHAGMIGSYIIENHVGIPVNCQYASEYINKKCLLGPHDLAIAISQSGETADTREALKQAITHNASVAGIVNVVGSQIARLAGRGMYLHAGPEIGVASTKAFTCQVAAINLLAAFLSKEAEFREEVRSSLLKVPAVLKGLLEDKAWMAKIEDVTKLFDNANHSLFLGRAADYPVALEGALKLKEISYIHAEGYPAGEMKHGPIALITDAMPVVFVVGAGGYEDIKPRANKDGTSSVSHRGRAVYEKIFSNMEEVKARKGKIICITDIEDASLTKISDYIISVPFINHTVAPMIKVLPLQLIAYYAAVRRNLDPDKPRNLAKSVTVL